MKIVHRLFFNKNQEIEDYLKKLGAELRIKELGVTRTVECRIDDDDKKWPEVKAKIEGTDVWQTDGLQYSKEDFDKSKWFHIAVSESAYPQPDENNCGFKEATYNLENYCRSCGVGKIQDKPFRLKSDIPAKTYNLLGLHWVFDAVFIRPGAKELFEEKQIAGVTYSHPIFDGSEKPIDNLYQLNVTTTLPKGYIVTENEEVTCKLNNEEYEREVRAGITPKLRAGITPKQGNTFCNRVKYLYPRTHPLTFDKVIFDNAPDFVKSFEWFGSGHKAILVSRKVYDLITSLGWAEVAFTPIGLR